MIHSPRRWRQLGLSLALPLVGLLAACGGGGTDEAPTALSAFSAPAAATNVSALAVTALGAGAADATWTPCASEGQTCAFTGTRQVRYGAAGTYTTLTLTGGTACSNAVFGDPLMGVVKSCDVATTTEVPPVFDPLQWTLCATEGGSCVFTGSRQVRYGTTTSAALLTMSAPVACSNAVFGDPAYGVAKSCWYANAQADTQTWVPCAVEGGYCSFTGTHAVKYASATAQVIGTYSDGVNCTNGVFGDPSPGVVKACSVAVDGATPPVTNPTVASISMPALTSATMGVPLRITAQALDAQGAVIPGVSLAWGVGDTGVASVDAAGLITPIRSGYTSVIATAGGQTVSGVLSVRGPTPIPTRSRYVGANLGGVVYYGSNFPFADLMKSGGGWASYNDDGSWNTPFPTTSPTGYPLSLAPGQHAIAAVAGGRSQYLQGQYTLLWDGEGTLSFPLSSVRIVQSGPNRIVGETNGDPDASIWVGIDSTNPANPVRNVRLLWPGTESTYATQPFNPEFLKKTAPYSMLRFMDWAVTNGSQITEWADRPHLEDTTWGTAKGVPLEAMIELANSLHVDPWFCIPHMASDDYVTRFAQLLHAKLDPTLKPHIEYSNEVWNTGFGQTQWAIARSDALGLARPFGSPSLFYAKRAVEMFKIMQQVYGAADAPRLVRVIAGQAAWTQFLENALAYADTAANADVMAIAPYFGAPSVGDPANYAASQQLSGSQVVDQMIDNIRGQTKNWMTSNAALAARYHLPMKAYESGPGDSVFYFPYDQHAPMLALYSAANASPHMSDAYAEYYSQWKSAGGDTMLQYSDIGGWSVFGLWGALQYVMQDPATSAKYQALLAIIAGSPTAASATAASTAVATSTATVP